MCISVIIFQLDLQVLFYIPFCVVCSQGKDVATTDVFQYNTEFKHKLCRIKINQIQMKETVSITAMSIACLQCKLIFL